MLLQSAQRTNNKVKDIISSFSEGNKLVETMVSSDEQTGFDHEASEPNTAFCVVLAAFR